MFGGQHRIAVNEIASAEDWAFVRQTPSRDAAGAVTGNVSLDTAEVVREVLATERPVRGSLLAPVYESRSRDEQSGGR
jgi:hypothetical protein